VTIRLILWPETGQREQRQSALPAPEAFAAPAGWTRYEGSFATPAGIGRGALQIGLVGDADEGAALGEIWVDDAWLGRGPAPE